MDLKTNYLGLELKNPLVISASPLSRDVDSVRQLEDRGAAALVMYSLFEEQINQELNELDTFLTQGTEAYAEALSYFPKADDFMSRNVDEYLEHIRRLKDAVDLPVMASLNGVAAGGWMQYGKLIEQAGADAIELNIYYVAAETERSSHEIEELYLEDVRTMKSMVSIPVALKVSPFFTAFGNMARRLAEAGADALVLFNRFYEPDIDLIHQQVKPGLRLSLPSENRLTLRWIALLYGRVATDFAATGGVQNAEHILKMILAGANVVMMASAILRSGERVVSDSLEEMEHWMGELGFDSIKSMRGRLSAQGEAAPDALERAGYLKTLQSYYQP